MEVAVLDGHAPQPEAFLAEQAGQREGGRDALGPEHGVGRGPAAAVDVFGVGIGVHQLDVADHEHAGGHHLEFVVLDAPVHDGGELVEGQFGEPGLEIRRLDGHGESHDQDRQETDDPREYIALFPIHTR